MVLQDLFDIMASGEFSGLALGNSVTGSIKEEAYPKIVNAINRGLTELYTKFLLKKKRVYLVQQPDVIRYYLRTQYLGYAGTTSSSTYLLDHTDEEFQNDVLRVLNIVDSDNQPIELNPHRVSINQTYFRSSGFDTLDLTTVLTDQVFTIQYQAKYPKIVITEDFDPESINLYYPPFIEEALINYVVSSLMKNKTTKASEGEGYVTNTWYHRYERACINIIEAGLAEESITSDNRFSNKGFV